MLGATGVGLALTALFLLSRTAQNSEDFDRLHTLLLINVAIYLVDWILLSRPSGGAVLNNLGALTPQLLSEPWKFYQLLSYGFLHAKEPIHVAGNRDVDARRLRVRGFGSRDLRRVRRDRRRARRAVRARDACPRLGAFRPASGRLDAPRTRGAREPHQAALREDRARNGLRERPVPRRHARLQHGE